MADPVHRLDWADQLQEALQLEDDAGRPVVLTVDEPLSAHGQRLCDALGVRVRVVTATAAQTWCPVEACSWNFVGDEAKAGPYLDAHLGLMHAGRKTMRAVLEEEAAVGQTAGSGSADPVSEPERAAPSSSATKKRDGRGPRWTEEKIVAAIVRWNDEHGAQPKADEWRMKQDGFPTQFTVARVFGSWSKALAAAGFVATRGGQPRKSSGGAVGDLAVTGSAVSTDPVKEATAVLSPEPPPPVQPHPEETTTRIMRIMHGQPIPNGWEFLQWLGTETGLEYPPSFKADVVLLRKAAA